MLSDLGLAIDPLRRPLRRWNQRAGVGRGPYLLPRSHLIGGDLGAGEGSFLPPPPARPLLLLAPAQSPFLADEQLKSRHLTVSCIDANTSACIAVYPARSIRRSQGGLPRRETQQRQAELTFYAA
jgi:hypothetical protein